MSLHNLAKELQKKGRGDDRMLVHMTPKEVAGLQAIAKAHGGSLTVNPDTGLVEAGFLKNIMPMVIGAGLTAATGGAAAPWMIGLGYGALETARTGDVGRGLMAGLGAYGGAGLAGMAGVGAAGAGGAGAGAGGAGAVTPEWTASSTGLNVVPGEAGTVAAAAPTTTPGWSQTSTGLNVLPGEAGTQATQNIAPTMGNAVRYGSTAAAPVVAGALEPPPPPGQEEYKRKYPELTLAENFRGYTPTRPNPYYAPSGLGYTGYAEGGEVQRYGFGGSIRDLFSKLAGRRELRVGENFQASEPKQPDNYYVPQGLGYAAGGDVRPQLNNMPTGGLAALQGMRDGYGAAQTMDGNMPQFSGGQYLKGDGDGMSDSIPATINGRQPARLADGEFVVPADVVSHLGNGSSDAGAKKLYKMMDKVRVARTGKKSQAPAVKTDKYMPA